MRSIHIRDVTVTGQPSTSADVCLSQTAECVLSDAFGVAYATQHPVADIEHPLAVFEPGGFDCIDV